MQYLMKEMIEVTFFFHVIRYDLLFLFCLGIIASLDVLQLKKKINDNTGFWRMGLLK